MNFVNTDLQKNNNKLNMKVDMNSSTFQRILDMISNSDLYKKDFFTSSFQHNIYRIYLFFCNLLNLLQNLFLIQMQYTF